MPPHAAEPDADRCSAATAQLPRTDPTRWRLNVASGRQTWHYHTEATSVDEAETEETWPQTDAERYALGLPVLSAKSSPGRCTRPGEAVDRGFQFFKLLQTEDGHWAGEYGGPMFLIPGLVIAYYICDVKFEEPQRLELIRYLANRTSPIDGGWGIHVEGVSTVFGTALNYVALRLLGISRDHPIAIRARRCLISLGGAIGIPSWGKFWLALLGLYDWDGMNPIIPELWLIPHFLPFHPGRYWIHTRAVYMSMSYLYGRKYVKPLDELTSQLREEIYILPYENIYWPSARNHIARRDLYIPHSTVLNIANVFLGFYESMAPEWLRKRALDEVYEQITMEDENTFYLDVGPVNKAMNMVCVWLAKGPSSPEFRAHLPRVADFLWMGKEGMMMNGTNGTQLWDTSFAVQAMVECGVADMKEHQACVRSAHRFLEDMQIKRNVPNIQRCYRHPSLGAWPFSTRDQGYTVSDCTAEGLKAVLCLQDLPSTEELIPYERLCQAVDILLGMQNSNGGFASYELIRAPHMLELINPAEVFADIMTDYSYPECTTASLLGLMAFSKRYPEYRAKEIQSVPPAFPFFTS
ncbi:terpenoid cyclases/protein prenyltransferase alpha-alpha toroid [Piptocephalis cylindrospora]|uniref:Terpenoid cyclases/protein prenyltransferase alpha-alpha toroid n=1 Tax=Piptocephalis cylindrospora TaxID=1907219 RepID=A0A4V1IXQ8_9FUNG|nr:terpenoid cyclases/protein prenyltransferase alpha-alpha toroid [Piptocephalis cylindrospora]|eukprot:RKP11909.1 terpenoid cyclases/protein prenyltransferase alpha-alpha toroid [Piptocephalis cylindrospora]